MAPAQRGSLFATVPARDYLQLRQSGLFQSQRVVRLVRCDEEMPRILRERLMNLAATRELVAQAFAGNTTKTALWFMTPSPQLDHRRRATCCSRASARLCSGW